MSNAIYCNPQFSVKVFDLPGDAGRFADTGIIYKRGERLFEYGACVGRRRDDENGLFEYAVDGSYGDYTIRIQINGDRVNTSCDCPYPGVGCKHTVAALLDISQNIRFSDPSLAGRTGEEPEEPYLSPDAFLK